MWGKSSVLIRLDSLAVLIPVVVDGVVVGHEASLAALVHVP